MARKRIRDYVKPPSKGPGFLQLSDIHRVKWTIVRRLQDKGEEEAIPVAIAAIDAAVTICEDHMTSLSIRLKEVHDLFTEKQIATGLQARWYQSEVDKTKKILHEVNQFRKRIAEERGRVSEDEDSGDSSPEPSSGDGEGNTSSDRQVQGEETP